MLSAGKQSWHALPAGRGQPATPWPSKCAESCWERGLPPPPLGLQFLLISLGLQNENLRWASITCRISKTHVLSSFWRRRWEMAGSPHHAYVLVWRADSSSVLQFSVCILFSCLHFSHFLLFPLELTTHILQRGDRQLPPKRSPCSRGAFRNVRLQIKSSNFPSAFLFSILRMEKAFCHLVLRYIGNSWQIIHHCLVQWLTWATLSHSQCNAKPWQSIPYTHGDSTQCHIVK